MLVNGSHTQSDQKFFFYSKLMEIYLETKSATLTETKKKNNKKTDILFNGTFKLAVINFV